MASTHFLMKTLKHVAAEMALHVLAYNMKRVMQILGSGGLIAAMRAWGAPEAPQQPPDASKGAYLRPRTPFLTASRRCAMRKSRKSLGLRPHRKRHGVFTQPGSVLADAGYGMGAEFRQR